MDSQTLLKEALVLPEQERFLLVERLLESLPPETDDITEEDFRAELQRRSAEIDQGKAGLIPWEQLKNETD